MPERRCTLAMLDGPGAVRASTHAGWSTAGAAAIAGVIDVPGDEEGSRDVAARRRSVAPSDARARSVEQLGSMRYATAAIGSIHRERVDDQRVCLGAQLTEERPAIQRRRRRRSARWSGALQIDLDGRVPSDGEGEAARLRHLRLDDRAQRPARAAIAGREIDPHRALSRAQQQRRQGLWVHRRETRRDAVGVMPAATERDRRSGAGLALEIVPRHASGLDRLARTGTRTGTTALTGGGIDTPGTGRVEPDRVVGTGQDAGPAGRCG